MSTVVKINVSLILCIYHSLSRELQFQQLNKRINLFDLGTLWRSRPDPGRDEMSQLHTNILKLLQVSINQFGFEVKIIDLHQVVIW